MSSKNSCHPAIRKSKCDGKQPVCKACADSGHECTWTAEEDSRRPATKQYVESLKNTNKFQADRIKALEAQLAAAGLKADNTGQEGLFNPNAGSPSGGLFSGMPLPSSSQTHSPAGSFNGELPPDAFLNPNPGADYDSHSDSESVAENLSNAASRLVIADGDLAAVGPSSLQFHRPSPITRTVPLDDAHGDGPKHTLHLSDDIPPNLSHSRNQSGASHVRSRSRSQTRSVGHSRASSVSPHGITPPSQAQTFASGVSPNVQNLFQTLSPPTAGSGAAPYLDPSSPGSDNFGAEQAAIDQILGNNYQGDQYTPNAQGEEEEEDGYDWRQMLPQDVELNRIEHDTLLDIFFKVFSSWCYRTVPDLFLRDMRRYLENTRVVKKEDAHSPSDSRIVGPKAVHYTPMLHNAILSIALAYSEDPQLSKRSTRAKFVEKAKSTLEIECSRPSLACVHALAYIASFYSGEGEQTLGFLYFGMSIRMSQALGLSIDCSSWVRSGHISPLDEVDRIWTYWSAYCLDKCWAFYVGRDHGLPQPLLKISQNPALAHNDGAQSASSQNSTFSQGTVHSPGPGPVTQVNYPVLDDKADNATWEWKPPSNWGTQGGLSRKTVSNTPSSISSAFYQTCKLMVLATRVMNTIWHLPKNASSESISPLALEVDQWLEDLPDAMRINRPKNTQALPHILMINMAHQWLQIILHRPFYTLTQNKSDQSIKRCDSGAEKILQYLAAWRRLYELRYVPITMVQISFIAGTTCLLKAIQSANMPEKRKTSLEGVTEIIRALSEMGSTWKSALQSAEALKTLRREQVSINERSPGPSRHPTVELQPPSVAGSRAQTMDMAYELHSSNPPFGAILEQSGNIYAEPDQHMNDPFLQGGYSAESPGSTHSGQYFSGNEGIPVHNQAHGHFVNVADPNGNLGISGVQVGLDMYGYGQLGYMSANDGRLRGGESFPNHPAGPFGGPAAQAVEGPEGWYGSGYSFSGAPGQQGHQQPYWPQ